MENNLVVLSVSLKFPCCAGDILYPIELFGYTTQQVLKGAIPDKHRFTLQIEASKKNAHKRKSNCSLLQ